MYCKIDISEGGLVKVFQQHSESAVLRFASSCSDQMLVYVTRRSQGVAWKKMERKRAMHTKKAGLQFKL